jgi:WD40 repeat protein
VTNLAFAQDGRRLVSGGADETARVWDVPERGVTASPRAELRGHTGLVQGVAFGPRGDSVVTGSSDGELRIWATAADPVRAELVAPEEAKVNDLAFDSSGRRVVTGGEDGTARVWALQPPRLQRELVHGTAGDAVQAVAFDRSADVIASAGTDGVVRTWDAATGAPGRTFAPARRTSLTDVALSPDGRLVLAGASDSSAWLWRRRDGRQVARLRLPAGVNAVAFSEDGRHLAVAAGRAVRVWRTDRLRRPVADFRDPVALTDNQVWSVAFGPDGLLAAGDLSGWWFVWDVESGDVVARAKAARQTVADVAFSRDGAYLATADWRGGAGVWRLPGGGLVTTIRPGSPRLEAIALAGRGRLVASGGDDGTTTVFECAECRPLPALVCLAEQRVTPTVRARDRDAFAACD